MKRLAILVLLLVILLTYTGCRENEDTVYRDVLSHGSGQSETNETVTLSAAPDGEAEALTGTLVIEEINEPSPGMEQYSMYGLAMSFAEKHPGVKVETSYGIDVDTWVTLSQTDPDAYSRLMDQYYQNMAVRMMSGEGADILAGMGYSYEKYGQSGALLDLAPFMNADETFRKEDYFTNIIEDCMSGGKLYKMPVTMVVGLICLDPGIAEQIEDVLPKSKEMTAAELFTGYHTALERNCIPSDYTFEFRHEPGKPLFLDEMLSSHISLKDRSVSLTDEGFVSYLINMKAAPIEKPWYQKMITGGLGAFQSEGKAFLFGMQLSIDDYENMRKEIAAMPETTEEEKRLKKEWQDNAVRFPRNFFDTPSMFVRKDDSGATVIPTKFLAATSSCKDPALAWEFIRYCIGDAEGVTVYSAYEGKEVPVKLQLLDGFAIHKGNARKTIEEQIGEGHQYAQWEEYLSGAKVGHGAGYVQEATLYQIMEEFLVGYYENDAYTAEECAQKMQDRAWLYVNE